METVPAFGHMDEVGEFDDHKNGPIRRLRARNVFLSPQRVEYRSKHARSSASTRAQHAAVQGQRAKTPLFSRLFGTRAALLTALSNRP